LALSRDGLRGKRIGVVRSQFAAQGEPVAALVESQLAVLSAQGATLIEIAEIPNTAKYGETELTVMLVELKHGLAQYLKDYAPGSAIQTLADVIAFNDAHKDKELGYFGQELFVKAQAMGDIHSPEYKEALATGLKYSREEGLDKVFAEHHLDAVLAPTGSVAWLTDFINGDASGASFTSPAAVAGYPHITVPAGFLHGLPCGLSLVGLPWSEASLIGMAYAYEQASMKRKAPHYLKTVNVL
jgi:amidase